MVIIKTTCSRCGEVDLTADKIKLRIAVGGKGTAYSFVCPNCSEHVRKPADGRVVQLLISGGVTPEVIGEERRERADRPVPAAPKAPAPPITYDDILEFHRELKAGVLENFLRNASV